MDRLLKFPQFNTLVGVNVCTVNRVYSLIDQERNSMIPSLVYDRWRETEIDR